jgi:hypothetical protein
MDESKGKTSVSDHYFCSATLRPSGCLMRNSICCLHCTKTNQCFDIKHRGTQPCNLKTMSYEEECEFSI